MQFYICVWTLTNWSESISIGTPIVLLLWFWYSQKHSWKQNYYSFIPGEYSGFSNAVTITSTQNSTAYAGFIMDIKEIDNNGYFRGELIYGEVESSSLQGIIGNVAASYPLYGRLKYRFYFKRNRHPFLLEKNSKYFGKLYIVSRLDITLKNKEVNDHTTFEYDITHYREKNSFSFYNQKKFVQHPKFPESFFLDKKINRHNDLFKDVFITVIAQNNLFGKNFREREM